MCDCQQFLKQRAEEELIRAERQRAAGGARNRSYAENGVRRSHGFSRAAGELRERARATMTEEPQ